MSIFHIEEKIETSIQKKERQYAYDSIYYVEALKIQTDWFSHFISVIRIEQQQVARARDQNLHPVAEKFSSPCICATYN